MDHSKVEIVICEDMDKLSAAAAEIFLMTGEMSLSNRGKFTVALSGGRTPVRLYRLLTSDRYKRGLDWSSVQVLWGDERCVPPDDRRSNYLLAYETMLKDLPLPEGNIHRIKGEMGGESARDYEDEVRRVFGITDSSIPEFDLIILGMGKDAHIASIFPGMAQVKEKNRIAMYVNAEHLALSRVTLTPAVINNALNIVFLVSGVEKSSALQDVIQGDYDPERFPAQITRFSKGQVKWLVDREAASRLTKRIRS